MMVSAQREKTSGTTAAAPPRRGLGRGGRRLLLAGCACIVSLAGVWPHARIAPAQEPDIRSVPNAATHDGREDRTLQRSLEMGEVEILGEVEKPRTMFILPRSPHQYILESDRKDFTERILSPMNRRKMEGLEQWRQEGAHP